MANKLNLYTHFIFIFFKSLYRLKIIFILLLVSLPAANAQDVHFSQFFETPLLRNPSLAGIFQGDIRVQSIYRTQWATVATPFQTGSLNFDMKKPIGKGLDFVSMGLQMMYDKAGAASLSTISALPIINYSKALSGEKNKYLSLGFMGGFVQRSFDRTRITTNNQYDANGYNPSLPDGEPFSLSNFSYLDGSIGISFNSGMGYDKPTNNYFVGLAYHHFNRPKNSFYKNPEVELQPKIVFSSGVKFSINETSYFTIHADYSQQGTYEELIGGALYSYKIGDDLDNPIYTIHLGAFLRASDAIIPIVKLDFQPISLAFSYDANISNLKTVSQGRGGVEFSLSYIGFFDKYQSSKFIPLCPKF
jgi:type IX secretion system PorP/SprF family membrane protein